MNKSMLEYKTLGLLNINSMDLDEYARSPETKLKELSLSLKDKIHYLQKKVLTDKDTTSPIKEDQRLYYLKQSLMDLENNRQEGFELHKLLHKVNQRDKEKDCGTRELLEKFRNSLKTNDNQWKLVTDFMTELFEQNAQSMVQKDVN